MAIGIMISTFGCNNGLILAGARAYYAMARDGLFFRSAGELNAAKVPAWGLLLQGVWAAFLVLPRTYDPATRAYGNLYSNLLDYVDLGGADLLHPDHRRRLPAAHDAAERRSSVPGVRLSGGSRAVHRRRGDDPDRAVRLSDGDHLAGADHRAAGRAGVLRVAADALDELTRRASGGLLTRTFDAYVHADVNGARGFATPGQ